MSLKKIIGRVLRKIIPFRLYKLVANGAIIVPKYYQTIIKDAEIWHNMSLEYSDDKEIMLMRKYAHIIDKGLHRKDISPGHSKECYLALCDSIKRLSGSKYVDDPTYQWAVEKKERYELLQQNPESVQPLIGADNQDLVSYEQLFALIKSRRSNRNFLDKTIDISTMAKIKETVNWASSSCNKQPVRIFATNNPTVAKECLKCCKGGTGFGEFIPSFWVFAANIRAYVWPSEIYLPVVDVCLGVQNVMLSALTLGITGTLLSWAQKSEEEDKQLRKLLNIPHEYQIVICSAMGYAAFNYSTPSRKITE